MQFLASVAATLQHGLFGWIIVAVVLTVFELVNPRERIPLGRRVVGMAFWTVSLLASTLVATVIGAGAASLHVKPLLTLPLFAAVQWAGPAAAICAVVLAAIFNDFFFYCYHRIQHRWLWRFHAVHHSIRDLSAVNSYHHVSEALVGLLLAAPTALVVADPGPALPFFGLFLYLHIVWIHSPTRFDFGPFRVLFADNRFHRIHHSLERKHFDKNFGAFTTLWDRLFGTAWFPARDEWPAVGLAEVDEPRDLREWLDLPARYRAATATSPTPVTHSAIAA